MSSLDKITITEVVNVSIFYQVKIGNYNYGVGKAHKISPYDPAMGSYVAVYQHIDNSDKPIIIASSSNEADCMKYLINQVKKNTEDNKG
jgi:hypothetical protein